MFFRLMFLQKAMMMEVKLEPVLFLSMYSIISCCRFQKLSFYKISWMIGPVTQIYLLSIFFIKSLLFNLTPSYKKMLIIYKIYEVFESKESSRMGIIAERYFLGNRTWNFLHKLYHIGSFQFCTAQGFCRVHMQYCFGEADPMY